MPWRHEKKTKKTTLKVLSCDFPLKVQSTTWPSLEAGASAGTSVLTRSCEITSARVTNRSAIMITTTLSYQIKHPINSDIYGCDHAERSGKILTTVKTQK